MKKSILKNKIKCAKEKASNEIMENLMNYANAHDADENITDEKDTLQ